MELSSLVMAPLLYDPGSAPSLTLFPAIRWDLTAFQVSTRWFHVNPKVGGECVSNLYVSFYFFTAKALIG